MGSWSALGVLKTHMRVGTTWAATARSLRRWWLKDNIDTPKGFIIMRFCKVRFCHEMVFINAVLHLLHGDAIGDKRMTDFGSLEVHYDTRITADSKRKFTQFLQ